MIKNILTHHKKTFITTAVYASVIIILFVTFLEIDKETFQQPSIMSTELKKRSPPERVNTISFNGITFTGESLMNFADSVINSGTRNVTATKNGVVLWEKEIYTITNDENKETDVQEEYIAKLEQKSNFLVVTTGRGKVFYVDPNTGEVLRKEVQDPVKVLIREKCNTPRRVPSVFINDINFTAESLITSENGAVINIGTNRVTAVRKSLIWIKEIYTATYDENNEINVHEDCIAKLENDNDILIVITEKGRHFRVNPETGEVLSEEKR